MTSARTWRLRTVAQASGFVPLRFLASCLAARLPLMGNSISF